MLAAAQLAILTTLFRHASEEASEALSHWLERPARISFEEVEQVPLNEAAEALGDPDREICCCAMGMHGRVTGQLMLAFDDASGLALADLLLRRPAGTSNAWGEIELSAALETANIIGCAYLNSLAKWFADRDVEPQEIVPTPPRFVREFAESLMEFVLMNQVTEDLAFLTRTEFRVDDAPVNCRLLFVPDAPCLAALREALPT
ncbi:MAG TPA: hypothetical protein VHB77_16595 [Planctomycetaceae bacterium]|nr:hypothetical protein [Planctomycetaceae bacterium]